MTARQRLALLAVLGVATATVYTLGYALAVGAVRIGPRLAAAGARHSTFAGQGGDLLTFGVPLAAVLLLAVIGGARLRKAVSRG